MKLKHLLILILAAHGTAWAATEAKLHARLQQNHAAMTTDRDTEKARADQLVLDLATMTTDRDTEKARADQLDRDLATERNDRTADVQARDLTITQLQTDLATMTTDRDKEKARADQLQVQLTDMTTDRDTEKARAERLQRELTNMTTDRDTEKARADGLQVQLTNKTQEHDVTKQALDAKTTEHNALQAIHGQVQAALDAKTTEHNALQATHGQTQKELADKTTEHADLQASHDKALQEHTSTQVERDNAHSELATLKSDLTKKDAEIADLTKQLNDAKSASLPAPAPNPAYQAIENTELGHIAQSIADGNFDPYLTPLKANIKASLDGWVDSIRGDDGEFIINVLPVGDYVLKDGGGADITAGSQVITREKFKDMLHKVLEKTDWAAVGAAVGVATTPTSAKLDGQVLVDFKKAVLEAVATQINAILSAKVLLDDAGQPIADGTAVLTTVCACDGTHGKPVNHNKGSFTAALKAQVEAVQ